jgi:hypothetical protein
MAKRTSSRSEARDNNDVRPKTSRSRGVRETAGPNAGPIASRRADELPNIPEPGDLADRAAQSESMGIVPTESEAREIGHANQSESMASEPSEEDIRLRAYHRYLERGGGHGAHFDDWLEAERELKQPARKDEA